MFLFRFLIEKLLRGAKKRSHEVTTNFMAFIYLLPIFIQLYHAVGLAKAHSDMHQ